MRKTKIVAMIIIFLLVLMYTINSYAVVADLKIEGEQRVKVGDTIQLEAIYNSFNEENPEEKIEENVNVTKKALWLSSEDTVATVNDEGLVTGVSMGIVKVTADYEVPAIYEITVLGENGEEPVFVGIEDEEAKIVEGTESHNNTVATNNTTDTNNETKSTGKDTKYYLFLFILILCVLLLLSLIIASIIKTIKKDDDDDELKL